MRSPGFLKNIFKKSLKLVRGSSQSCESSFNSIDILSVGVLKFLLLPYRFWDAMPYNSLNAFSPLSIASSNFRSAFLILSSLVDRLVLFEEEEDDECDYDELSSASSSSLSELVCSSEDELDDEVELLPTSAPCSSLEYFS